MSQTLPARRLITAFETIEFPLVTIDDDGIIANIEPGAAPRTSDTTLTTTFFDIHTHGGANHDVMEGSPKPFAPSAGFMGTHGVGHYLPTTVTAPVDKTLSSLEGIARAIDLATTSGWDVRAARPVGIHLEGPFISHAKRGVHPPADILPPDIALFDRFQQAAGGHIRLITIAPETPGALDLIRHCVGPGSSRQHRPHRRHFDRGAGRYRCRSHKRNPHLQRHARAQPSRARRPRHRARLRRPLRRVDLRRRPRSPGTGAPLAEGEDRATRHPVTDSMAAAGMPDGDYTLGTFAVRVANGRAFAAEDLTQGKHTLAGSVLTLDRAVANLQHFTGASLEVAARLASRNPASLLGMERAIANVAPGQPANFNVFNKAGELERTILRGVAVA